MSILDQMVAATAERKQSVPLTPVAGELPPVMDVDAILRAIDATEKSMSALLSILRGQVRKAGGVGLPDPGMELDEGAALRAAGYVFGDDITPSIAEDADEFAADFAAKQAAAQAATFSVPTRNGWVCPEHGVGEPAVSPKGRKYHKCTVCTQFER